MRSLPHIEHEHPITNNERLLMFPDSTEITNIHSYVDSDWGNDKALFQLAMNHDRIVGL